MKNWLEDAKCKGMATRKRDIFFSNREAHIAEAKLLCSNCPVIDQCRAMNDEAELEDPTSMFGIFGGETVRERRVRRGEISEDDLIPSPLIL